VDIKLYKNGPSKIIWFFVDDKGECPAEDFLDRLEKGDVRSRRKLLKLLDYTAKNGPPEKNEDKFKCFDTSPVCEFKCYKPPLRLFSFKVKDKTSKKLIGYCITHGSKKPGDRKKDYEPDMDTTLRIMGELSEKGVF